MLSKLPFSTRYLAMVGVLVTHTGIPGGSFHFGGTTSLQPDNPTQLPTTAIYFAGLGEGGLWGVAGARYTLLAVVCGETPTPP